MADVNCDRVVAADGIEACLKLATAAVAVESAAAGGDTVATAPAAATAQAGMSTSLFLAL